MIDGTKHETSSYRESRRDAVVDCQVVLALCKRSRNLFRLRPSRRHRASPGSWPYVPDYVLRECAGRGTAGPFQLDGLSAQGISDACNIKQHLFTCFVASSTTHLQSSSTTVRVIGSRFVSLCRAVVPPSQIADSSSEKDLSIATRKEFLVDEMRSSAKLKLKLSGSGKLYLGAVEFTADDVLQYDGGELLNWQHIGTLQAA